VSNSLQAFIVSHSQEIIDRARSRVKLRMPARSTDAKLENGIPLFLTQLADALAPADGPTLHLVGSYDVKRITDTAALNGQELFRKGFTVGQVVHGYGDICQVVTELAGEMDETITPAEFQSFNECLDDAIAGAVMAFGRVAESDRAYEGGERFGVFVHELRNLLTRAVISFDLIKRGTVPLGGSVAAMHSRSLASLAALVERSLAEVRLGAGLPNLQRTSVAEFIEGLQIGAAMEAEGAGIELSVDTSDGDVLIDADVQLLTSAVTNLLQNAFKFTRPRGKVALTTRASADRVSIEVSDECGGLPPGKVEELFQPFSQSGADRQGLGLGLTIARNAVRANQGEIAVRDVPGIGCVFTIDLPRQLRAPTSMFPETPTDDSGARRDTDRPKR